MDVRLGDTFLALVARALSAETWTVDAGLVVRSSVGRVPGSGEGAILGRSLYDLFETSDPAHPAIAAHRRALMGEVVAYDAVVAGRQFRTFLQPFAEDGANGVLGFAVEAMSERNAVASLRDSEEALALAQRAAHLGSWTHDLRREAVTWSNELYALCGVEAGGITPTAELLESFVHPEDRVAFEAAIEDARDEHRAFGIDTRLTGLHGEQRWVQHRGRFSYEDGRATRVIGTVLDITARKRAEEHLAYQANYDDLTGLPNRKRLAELLRDSLHAQQGEALLAVLYLDLDRFKAINDTLGHDAGDVFLRSVAPRLLGTVGENDIVARRGGDEFIVVLPNVASVGDVASVAERVVAAFARPIAIDGRDLYSTVSVGISIFPNDGDTPEALVRAADAALYRAKSVGRGTFHFYDAAATNGGAVDRLELEQRIRRAFGRDEFVLHFQPIVDRFERPVAVEVLLRWEDPERGTILPDRFIPICEESGFIVELGTWVVRRALEHVAAWDARGMPPLRIAVNLSARQIIDPKLAETLADAIERSGVAADRLELEVTESVVVSDVIGARRIIAGLKMLGVRISLDDFGTGYSALSYLKHFSVDALKIDRTFVRDLAFDRGDSAIVSAVIALGHAMDLRIVAEGVETAEQAALVRRLGCDEMQGYYFARPMPADDVERVLRAWSGIAPLP